MANDVNTPLKSFKEVKLAISAKNLHESSKPYLDKCLSILEKVNFDYESEVDVFSHQVLWGGKPGTSVTIAVGDVSVTLDHGTLDLNRAVLDWLPLSDSAEAVIESLRDTIPAKEVELFRQFYEQALTQRSGRIKVASFRKTVYTLDVSETEFFGARMYVTLGFVLSSDLSKAVVYMTYSTG